MPDTDTKSFDLSFVTRDIRNQIAHSRDILALAEKTQRIAASTTDPTQKQALLELASSLIGVATQMTANVASTSSGASTTVSGVGSSHQFPNWLFRKKQSE